MIVALAYWVPSFVGGNAALKDGSPGKTDCTEHMSAGQIITKLTPIATLIVVPLFLPAVDEFVDTTLTDMDTGEPVKLSDFHGKWVVLETGSSTCSMYSKNIPDMKGIENEYPDVEFLVIYVREAHPGERLHQHKNFEEKLAAARLLKPRYGEHRRILVDSHEGGFHRMYGMMPNILYVIRPDGKIHYRSNWATAGRLRAALADRQNFHTYENADVKELKATRGLMLTIRTMWTEPRCRALSDESRVSTTR